MIERLLYIYIYIYIYIYKRLKLGYGRRSPFYTPITFPTTNISTSNPHINNHGMTQ